MGKLNILHSYKNGTVDVDIYSDGTKIRSFIGKPQIIHPESIDCKITNWCDAGCKYCHEESTTEGLHGDLNKLKAILISLPAGVELALGGGNPLAHPDLNDFLIWAKKRGLIINLTVNQLHLKQYLSTLKHYLKTDLIKGLGISVVNNHYREVLELKKISNNIVFHVIAGINKLSKLDELIELGNCKTLVLGYKQVGRGINHYSQRVQENIEDWKENLMKYRKKSISLSFDNLSISQLDIKNQVTEQEWDAFYMGDDFTYTMYIDAILQQYGPSSTAPHDERKSFNDMSLFEYFINNKLEIK